MLTHEQESPGPLFELAGLNFLGRRDIGREGATGVRFDFLDLPGIFAAEEPIRRKCTIEVKAEQFSVPTYPECACLDGVAPPLPFRAAHPRPPPRAEGPLHQAQAASMEV